MKKYFSLTLSVIAAAILFASCGGGGGNRPKESVIPEEPVKKPVKVKTDLDRELIAGRVTSVRQRVYWCLEKFGRLEKGRRQNLPVSDYLKVFNEKGFLTEEVHYDANDKVANMRKLAYGADGLVASEEIYKGATLSEKIVSSYDSRRRIVRREVFDNAGKLKSKVEYSYNAEQNETDEDIFDSSGKLSAKFVSKYENELLMERAKYWGSGSLAAKEYYTYNNENKLIELASFKGADATFDKKTSYEDYEGENYTAKVSYDVMDEKIEKTFYAYDKAGHLLARMTYVNSPPPPVAAPAAANDSAENDSENEQENESDSKKENEPENEPEKSETEIEGEGKESEKPLPTEILRSFKGTGDIYVYSFDKQNNWTRKISYKIDRQFEASSFEELGGTREVSDDATRQFYYERVYTLAEN
ncbi:MAG: hypothetical protein LBD35_03440 [Prevotellaceae bacterium]|jgi:hypothetical protein|nr:hypothetical protein [Prevotellaceae bacterium]